MSDLGVKCNRLQNLLRMECNQKCADCGSPHVQWASIKFGVFICTLCSSSHRKLGAHLTKVKNLSLDKWNDSDVENMDGNEVARQTYEKYVPVWYRQLVPDDSDPEILREHWIRAKYEREEFRTENVKLSYASSSFSVQIQKKDKDCNVYRPRTFMVLESLQTLSYYIKEETNPKATFKISEVEVALAPKSMKHPSSMQLYVCRKNSDEIRNIFVKDEKPEKIVNLYMAIRRCKLLDLQISYPHWPTERIMQWGLPHDFTVEGWLWKTGPRPTDEYRKRWVTLMNKRIMYLKNPLDSTSKGQFKLGSSRNYHAVATNPDCMHIRRELFPFKIHTPSRVYQFAATTSSDQQTWINAVNRTLSSDYCQF